MTFQERWKLATTFSVAWLYFSTFLFKNIHVHSTHLQLDTLLRISFEFQSLRIFAPFFLFLPNDTYRKYSYVVWIEFDNFLFLVNDNDDDDDDEKIDQFKCKLIGYILGGIK